MNRSFNSKWTASPSQNWLIFGLSLGMITSSLIGSKAVASEPDTLLLLTTPLNAQQVNQLWAGNLPADRSIVAANTVSQSDMTIPSLWWAQKQFGGTLLNYWIAYSGTDGTPRRIDLLVDQQVWNGTSYINRYAFLTQMGETAKDFNYNLRVFTWRGDLLGAYVCDFSGLGSGTSGAIAAVEGSQATARCDVFLGLSDPGAFQTNTLFAAP